MWFIILSIVFPKGIGFSVLGNNVDVNKILILLSALLTADAVRRNSFRIDKYSLGLLFIICTCLIFSVFWLSGVQYLIFAYYVLMYVSAFWVADFLFKDSEIFVTFTNNLALALIVSGVCALLDHYFKVIPFELFRPENESFIWEYNRGVAVGSVQMVMYKGWDSASAWFSVDRFVWLSWTVFAYRYCVKEKTSGLKAGVLMAASLLGVIEIVLSQARVLGFVALLLLMLLLVVSLTRISKWGHPVGIIVLSFLIVSTFSNYVVYFLSNIYSVFDFYRIEAFESALSYSFEVDKRGQAINAIINDSGVSTFCLPLGPLFSSFTNSFLSVPSQYFDNVSAVVTSVFEFGLIPWIMMALFIIHAVLMKKDKIGNVFVVLLIMTILATSAVYTPRFYYYLFFMLGAVVSRGNRVRLSSRTVPLFPKKGKERARTSAWL